MPDDADREPSMVAPLGVWLGVQLAALLLPAARVGLSHRYPTPVESTAVDVMVVAQVFFAALLGPLLFQSWRSTLAVIATTGPMLAGACLLAGGELVRLWAVGGYLFLWMSCVACWTVVTRGHLTTTAVATTWAAGGIVLKYLQVEFGQTPVSSTVLDVLFGPIVAAVTLTSEQNGVHYFVWLTPVAVLLLGFFVFLLRSRQVIHRLIPHPN